jgi:hypothetical protein
LEFNLVLAFHGHGEGAAESDGGLEVIPHSTKDGRVFAGNQKVNAASGCTDFNAITIL